MHCRKKDDSTQGPFPHVLRVPEYCRLIFCQDNYYTFTYFQYNV